VISDKKERTMPHVVVKLWPGKSEQQKVRLAEEIVKDVMAVLQYEEVGPQDWTEKVYKPGPTLWPVTEETLMICRLERF
jgi:4-oxalocrotonate tautomerase